MAARGMIGGGGLVLIGGGGHAVVVAEAAWSLADTAVAGVLDDVDEPLACQELGVPRLGGMLDQAEGPGIVCVGDLAQRRRAIESWEGVWARVVHDYAAVPTRWTLGEGGFVGVGAIVMPACDIGPHAIVNSGAIVEHHTSIGENTHVGPGAILGGGCLVGHDVLIGLGARVLPGVSIGNGATIGAGAVVIEDVRAGDTVAGVPARSVVG